MKGVELNFPMGKRDSGERGKGEKKLHYGSGGMGNETEQLVQNQYPSGRGLGLSSIISGTDL